MSRVLKKNVEDSSRDLTVRTSAEALWLWRIAQPYVKGRAYSSLSQADAARKLGLSLATYSRMEEGGRSTLNADDVFRLLSKINLIRTPTDSDLCRLARRRNGMRLRDVANYVGVSAMALSTWERDGDMRLIEFWKSKGYVFPEENEE